jgi:hypothetical protein
MRKFLLLILTIIVTGCGTAEETIRNESSKKEDRLTDSTIKPGDTAVLLDTTCLIYVREDLEEYIEYLSNQDMEALYVMDMEENRIDCGVGPNTPLTVVEVDGKAVKVDLKFLDEPKTAWLGLSINALAKYYEGNIVSISDEYIEVENISNPTSTENNTYTVFINENTGFFRTNGGHLVLEDFTEGTKVRVILEKTEMGEIGAREVILLD